MMKRRTFCRSAAALTLTAALPGTRAWAVDEAAAGKILGDVNCKTRTGGDTVLVRGTLGTDKDFGFGYKYELIVEDADVAKE